MSQLDLASAAGTTARHISFIATGRFRGVFPTRELGSQAMDPVNRVLAAVLRRHEPYPAWVARQPFTFLQANAGAEALFPGLAGLSPEQLDKAWHFGRRAVFGVGRLIVGTKGRGGRSRPCPAERRPGLGKLAGGGREGPEGCDHRLVLLGRQRSQQPGQLGPAPPADLGDQVPADRGQRDPDRTPVAGLAVPPDQALAH